MEEKHVLVANKQMTERTFGERLKSIRTSKDFTQKQLAEMVGITAATLSAYESGAKSPVVSTAAEIAKTCGVTIDWLCGIENARKTEDIAYSDIIRYLLRLSEATGVDPTVYERAYMHDTVGAVEFSDPVIVHFLEEWGKVKKLYDDKVINKSVYDPWIAQQLLDYDCSTEEIPQKLEEELRPPF